MAGKARMRPSFKKHTRRYEEVIAPAKTLTGQKNLAKGQSLGIWLRPQTEA